MGSKCKSRRKLQQCEAELPSISGTSVTLESPERFTWFFIYKENSIPLPERGHACQAPAQTVRHFRHALLPKRVQMGNHNSLLTAEPQSQGSLGRASPAPLLSLWVRAHGWTPAAAAVADSDLGSNRGHQRLLRTVNTEQPGNW